MFIRENMFHLLLEVLRYFILTYLERFVLGHGIRCGRTKLHLVIARKQKAIGRLRISMSFQECSSNDTFI